MESTVDLPGSLDEEEDIEGDYEEEDYEEEDEEEDEEEEEVMCTNEFNPQCTEDGTLVGSNPCKAAQNKTTDEGVTYSREWCFFPGASDLSVVLSGITGNSVDVAESVEEEEEEEEEEGPMIVCTADFNPQCTEDGTRVGSNPCKAAQNKKYKGVPVKNEWCMKSQPSVQVGPSVEAFSAEAKPLFDNTLLAAFTSLPTIVTPSGAEVPCCLLYLDPVCTSDQQVVHISPWLRLCDATVPKPSFVFQYHEDWCPEEIRTRKAKPQLEEEVEDEEVEVEKPKHCLCPLIWNPYCDDSGEIKAGNKCEAECKGLDMAVVSMDKCNHGADEEETADTTSKTPEDAAARLEEAVLLEDPPKAEIFVEADVEADEDAEVEEVPEGEMRSMKQPVCICPLIWGPRLHQGPHAGRRQQVRRPVQGPQGGNLQQRVVRDARDPSRR